MVYNTLNRLKWTGRINKCVVTILHRGVEGNRRKIPGRKITQLKRSYFVCRNRKETTIPMHRILEVRQEGKVLWERGK